MDKAEKFDCLMQIIEYWTEDRQETDRYEGPFRYLSKELWIREICVIPGCSVSIMQLKTFLAFAVLKIYPWNNRSKISYRDIQKSLAGGDNHKKYSFYFEELDKCFSRKENAKAAGKTRLCGNSPVCGDMEEKTVSLYLLEKIQEMARIKIGEYWSMCNQELVPLEMNENEYIKWKQKKLRSSKEAVGGQAETDSEMTPGKQNKYMECLLTIALHEIFTRECERQFGLRWSEADARYGSVGDMKEMLKTLAEVLKQADGNDHMHQAFKIGTCKEDVQEKVQGIVDYTQRLSKAVYLLNLYLEHVIGVETEIMLIMILEARNLSTLKNDGNQKSQIDNYLEFMKDRCTENFQRFNKNRGKYYRKLEKDIKQYFLSYMEQTGSTVKQNFSEALFVYLETLKKGKFDEGSRGRIWEAQRVLVMPLWSGETNAVIPSFQTE